MMPWFPDRPPIYDPSKSYQDNAAHGPFFSHELYPRSPGKPTSFLGFSLHSPLGVPAGPLLTSRWVTLASRLGFDLLTYKTIRSRMHPGHPLPNILYVTPSEGRFVTTPPPQQISELTITNSLGMPSRSPEFLMEDIERAKQSLLPGQLLVVSVVGTAGPERSFEDDFVYTAKLAQEAGAEVIEANFSCPNVGKSDACLYMHPETVFRFSQAIARAIHPTPLILKVGLFRSLNEMRDALMAAARAGVRAICGLNSVSSVVVDSKGGPALGPERPTSGVCGAHIRERALRFIQESAALIRSERLDLTLMGCGGIMEPSHFDLFLEAGASVALSATGMMWDPYLAYRYGRQTSTR